MKSKHAITIAFFLNLSFSIIECIFGLLFQSSAILADSLHDLGDALAIGLSAFLDKKADQKADDTYTLGYGRFRILGALLIGIILISGSVTIFLENIPHLLHPQAVNKDGMLGLGIVAILINLLASRLVAHKHSHHDKMLSLHFLEDILGWVGVIIVSLVLQVTDWYFLDPLLSLIISSYILSQSLPTFWSSLQILMNHKPQDLDLNVLQSQIEQIPGVSKVLSIQVWSIDGQHHVASLHIQIQNSSTTDNKQIKEQVHQLLLTYHIHQTTIECDDSLNTHLAHA